MSKKGILENFITEQHSYHEIKPAPIKDLSIIRDTEIPILSPSSHSMSILSSVNVNANPTLHSAVTPQQKKKKKKKKKKQSQIK